MANLINFLSVRTCRKRDYNFIIQGHIHLFKSKKHFKNTFYSQPIHIIFQPLQQRQNQARLYLRQPMQGHNQSPQHPEEFYQR